MADTLPTDPLPVIHPDAVPGFWIRNVGDETRIGAVHRSPRIIGAIVGVGIWLVVFWQPFSNLGNPSLYDVLACLLGVLIGIAFRRHLLDLLFGRTEVRISPGSAVVVRGVGLFDELERFDPAGVTGVGGHDTTDGRTWTTLEGRTPIALGVNWTEPRREAVARALAVHLGVPLLKVRSSIQREREVTDTEAFSPAGPPPRGVWTLHDGPTVRIGASCRSLAAIPAVIFALLWNGAILAIAWLTLTGGKPQLLPLLVLHALFGAVLAWASLHTSFGRIEVRLAGGHAELFEGVGRFRKPTRFAVADVKGVRETIRSGARTSTTLIAIDTSTDKPIECGSSLTPARRRWLRLQLYDHLVRGRLSGHTSPIPAPTGGGMLRR